MEIKCVVFILTVFGVTIYGAYGKPAESFDFWTENIISDNIVSTQITINNISITGTEEITFHLGW